MYFSPGTFIDRFSPSEGVASHAFKTNNDANSHDHSHEYPNHATSYKAVAKTPSASNAVASYVTAGNLYAFPPNNINYPAQMQENKLASPSSSVNSYSWPASGSLKDTNPYQYNGPVTGGYLPPSNNADNTDESKANAAEVQDDDLDGGAGDDSVGVLPASAMDQINGANENMPHDMRDKMPNAMDSHDG